MLQDTNTIDITCLGTDCPIRETCKRYTTSITDKPYFNPTPGYYNSSLGKLVWTCVVYWGDMQDDILKTLTTIVTK